MKSANIVKYICLTLLALILLAAYSSRSIENMTLTKVVLAKPFKGTITTPVEGFRPEIIRVRTQANLMLEDIFIDSGDEIKFGDPIASVYSVDVDRQIADIETANGTTGSMEYAFLTMLRENGYVIHAEAAGKILSVPVKQDTLVTKESILYKYIPEGSALEANIVTSHDVIVPLSALIKLSGDNYLVYFAVPLTGKGEAGQYRVVSTEVKLLASDDSFAAIDAIIRDNRQIIVSYEKPISHMQKVRVG